MDRRTIHKITEVLENDDYIIERWAQLAVCLNVEESKILALRRCCFKSQISSYDLIYDIINDWKASHSGAAPTLEVFIQTLKANNFTTAAGAFFFKFYACIEGKCGLFNLSLVFLMCSIHF